MGQAGGLLEDGGPLESGAATILLTDDLTDLAIVIIVLLIIKMLLDSSRDLELGRQR